MLGRLKGDEARGWGQGQHKGWDIGGGGVSHAGWKSEEEGERFL